MKNIFLLVSNIFLSACCFAQPVVLNLDLTKKLQRFDGVGAVFSYEKLFYDYPQKQRDEILDYLFKPKFGAALQIVKVEIGYDGNNTAMAWPSHQRLINEEPDFNRGFAWWLMSEAKKRNPEIKLAGLHWGYPAYAQTDELKADFIFKWLEGAARVHHLNIDYIGGNQNESALEPNVTKLLRKKLDQSGFSKVRIIAADEGARVTKFQVMDLIKSDREYSQAVDVIGVHYKSRPASFMPASYLTTGKPIWSSEDGGGTFKAKDGYSFFRQWFKLFVELPFSASVGWLATASAYDNMPWPNAGIIKAKEPWSGHYEIGNSLWTYAHLTQFSEPGWNFLEAPHYLVPETKSGQIIALVHPKNEEFTLFIGTSDTAFPDKGVDVELNVKDWNGKSLKLRKTNINKSDSIFVSLPNSNFRNGSVQVHLEKNCLYTLSSIDGGDFFSKEVPSSPEFLLPYKDNFERPQVNSMARFFVDVNGAFEVEDAFGRSGKALAQKVSESPVQWHYKSRPLAQPLTEFGDMSWKDYTVKADFLFEDPGTIYLGERFDGKMESSGDYLLEGYWLTINEKGEWKLLRKDPSDNTNKKGSFFELAAGKIPALGINEWFNCSITSKGDQLSVTINNKEVCHVRDGRYKNGNVALGSVNPESDSFFSPSKRYTRFQVDNFEVRNTSF